MDLRMILIVAVIVCLQLASANDSCHELHGFCVSAGLPCAGKKILGKCPSMKICCVPDQPRCHLLGGNCTALGSECIGTTIPEKCPEKHTCCLPKVSDNCKPESGKCIHMPNHCEGRRIPYKCPKKCQILCVPACKTPDYTYIEELNTCVKFYNYSAPHKEAMAVCKNDSGRLLVLDTVSKDSFFKNYIKNVIKPSDFDQNPIFAFWIGLFRQLGGAINDYYWATGVKQTNTFKKWHAFSPNGNNCTTYSLSQFFDIWFSEDCAVPQYVFCEYDAFC